MALASSDWLMAAGWRQGLFAHCIGEKAPPPLPFNVVDPPGCYKARDEGEVSVGIVQKEKLQENKLQNVYV